jgi:peptide/nickel transport system permease protein
MIIDLITAALKFLFSLLLLVLAAHFILINMPGNPAAHFISDSATKSASAEEETFIRQALEKRGLYLPDFYFSVSSAALPPVYFEVFEPEIKRNIKQMAYQFGNPETVENFFRQLKRCQPLFDADSLKIVFRMMLTDYCATLFENKKWIHQMAVLHPENAALDSLYQLQTEMHMRRTPWKKFIPIISFHPQNRFHQYLLGDGENAKGLLQGHLGVSWQTRLPVAGMIVAGFRWTLPLAFVSLMISLSLSVLIGIKSGASKGSVFDRISAPVLFILYSIPVFWLAILLLLLFSNPHVLNWLPVSGVQPAGRFPEGYSMTQRFLYTLPYLVLPLICFIVPSLAFMTRAVRASTAELMQQDFIRTARAKGLSEKTIRHKHVFRNLLLTVITLCALAWPALLSGSVLIETIFSIPGIGLLTFQAVQQQDYPVLAGVFIVTGVITLFTFSMADILYRIADPRLKT